MIYVHVIRTHDGVSTCVYLQIIVSICPAERGESVLATLPLAPLPTSLMIGIYLTYLPCNGDRETAWLRFGFGNTMHANQGANDSPIKLGSRMKP